MKKLMLAATIAVAAIVANASSVTWSVSNLTGPNPGDSTEGYWAYAFLSSVPEGDTVTTTYTVASVVADILAKNDPYNYNDNGIYVEASGAGISGKVSSAGSYDWGTNAGDTLTGFLVIINGTDLLNGDEFAVTHYMVLEGGEGGSVVFNDPGADAGFSFNAAGGTWTAVPEPTSGLLLLLGMAGLALKRKRA